MASSWPSSVLDPPQFTLPQNERWDVVRTPFEAGYVQTFSRWSTAKMTWELHWSAMSTAQLTALSTHWRERKGGAGSFEWRSPLSSSTHTVRFVEDSIRAEFVDARVFSVSLSLEEV